MSRQLAAFTPAYFFNDEHRPETYEVVWEAARLEDGRMRAWEAVIRTKDHLLYGWYDLSDSNRVNWSSTANNRQAAPAGEEWRPLRDGHHITQDGICVTCNTIPCRSL